MFGITSPEQYIIVLVLLSRKTNLVWAGSAQASRHVGVDTMEKGQNWGERILSLDQSPESQIGQESD